MARSRGCPQPHFLGARVIKRWWQRASMPDRILVGYFIVAVIGFCAVSLLGVSQSSIGIGTMQVDGRTSEDVVAGQPRPIRGDEFSRGSPLLLGQAAVCSADFVSPLGEDPTVTAAAVNDGWAEHLVFADRTAVQFACGLPDEMLFAWSWWIWIFLVAVGLPLLLRLWDVPLPLIALATFGSIVAPSVMWWSFSPLQPVALACIVACSIGLAARAGGRYRYLMWALAAGVGALAMARLPFAYLPFALPIAMAIILPMFVGAVVDPKTRRAALVVSVSILVGGAALALAVLLENRSAMEALTNTIYPGDRRSSGQLLDLGFVFGAPFLEPIQYPDTKPEGTNQSAISTAWSIAIIPVLVIAARSAPIATWLGRRAPVFWTLSAVLLAWFSWVLFNWPTRLGEALPLVSSIPPDRAAAVLGIPSLILLAVVLGPQWRSDGAGVSAKGRVPGILVPTLMVLLIAGSSLQNSSLPFIGSVWIFSVAVLTAISLAAMGSGRVGWRSAGLVLAMLGMAWTVWRVSPVMVGVGDLRDSSAEEAVVAAAGTRDPADGYWGVTTWELTALLISNGVPTLNGDQWAGPSDQWLVLDPDREYEEAWNRAAAVIRLTFDSSLPAPVITSPQADAIELRIAPCDPALAELNVRGLMTAARLSDPCLELGGSFEYADAERYIYLLKERRN